MHDIVLFLERMRQAHHLGFGPRKPKKAFSRMVKEFESLYFLSLRQPIESGPRLGLYKTKLQAVIESLRTQTCLLALSMIMDVLHLLNEALNSTSIETYASNLLFIDSALAINRCGVHHAAEVIYIKYFEHTYQTLLRIRCSLVDYYELNLTSGSHLLSEPLTYKVTHTVWSTLSKLHSVDDLIISRFCDECFICGENPDIMSGDFAILENCYHVFCVKCFLSYFSDR